MNSNYSNKKTSTTPSFDFDLGIGSNRSNTSLNDQKNKSNYSNFNSNSYMTSSSFSQSKQPSSAMPSWQPGKPSWTHQPAPSNPGLTRSELGGPNSMVGDISGKSWNSTKPATGLTTSTTASIGVVGVVSKNPNLFGDLVSSALGPNKGGMMSNSSSNVPLKNAAPVKGSFSMGGVADSLPKVSGSNVGLGSSQSYGSLGGVSNSGVGMTKSSSVGGNSMRNLGGSGGGGVGMSSNKDPFGSLVDFSSKPMNGGGSLNSSSKATASTSSNDFGFGDFQNAPKSNAPLFPSGNTGSNSVGPKPMSGGSFSSSSKAAASTKLDDFGIGDFLNAPKSNNSAFPSGNTGPDLFGSNSTSVPNMDSFATQNPAPPAQSSGGDSFDMFFSSTTNVGSGGAAVSDSAVGGQQFSGGDDWGMDSEFVGHDGGNTTELEGLPPPPAGVSAASAKAKGLDNYKQGQFADAIKWLSWAEILIEKAGDVAGSIEVLTCRASCYKEVGEYKKAVADCTKILDRDGENVTVLVQRALLYESMEKYRLGADDLRTVMKIDPANRLARSTIHRLNKMAE